MAADSESLFYVGIGPVSAVFLGMALIPLRDVTTASNLTFAFLALIIVVAEVGGRWAAVAPRFPPPSASTSFSRSRISA
jgi:hypothetical protein